MRAGGLGAVFRTVLETMRTLFVWLVDLVLFYTPLGLGKLGESWSSYSLIQAAGCALQHQLPSSGGSDHPLSLQTPSVLVP